jgi:hypothetical protein
MKKKRLQVKYEQFKNHLAIARKERTKREAQYESGVNMKEDTVDGYTAEELEDARKHSKEETGTYYLPPLPETGHSTTNSSKCLHYNGRPKTKKGRTPAAHPEPSELNDDDVAEDITGFQDLQLHGDEEPLQPGDASFTHGLL